MITRDNLQTAYCFLHQKERVYRYSTMEWQRDDIEYAIAQYVSSMQPELYAQLSAGRPDYLLDHSRFHEDMTDALAQLEALTF